MFLGSKSSTVDNCIITSTSLTLDLLVKQQIIKALFFIDTSYMMRLCVQHNAKKKVISWKKDISPFVCMAYDSLLLLKLALKQKKMPQDIIDQERNH